MIVFHTLEGKHLGFCLAHPNLEVESGRCIFQIMPLDPSLYEDEKVHFFFELKNQGEHEWYRNTSGTFQIRFQGEQVLTLKEDETIEAKGEILGRWFIHKRG